MLAATYDRTGPATDVLRVRDVETPEPGPGEVRVRVAVSGVNPTDWKSRAGASFGVPDVPFLVPNQDGAGTIDAVGAGVDPSRAGERVWVYFAAWQRRWGTAAECTVVPAEQAVPLPAEASFDLGASLGIPALTAHRCLLADGPIDGAAVLVAGGAGAVGHAAIELARWAGARVVATVSSEEKAELARAAGAEEVVNYREPGAAERIRAFAPGGVDRIVEVAPSRNAALDAEVAARHAVTSFYANEGGGGEVAVPVRPYMVDNLTLRGVLVYTVPEAALRRAVADVSAAVAAGALTTLPLHRFPLEAIAGAHDAVEGGAVGKVVVDVP
ncbi:MAG TPA: NADPH:quinone reductase [Solirubrobacteraceae bacterium]|nr:NADPH:quinone reductase [Solirubrobacteraceae bacterium]